MSEQELSTKAPPTEDDKVFSPVGELARIREAGDPRGALTDYKDRFVHQKEGIAQLQADFVHLVHESPDVPPADLESFLSEEAERLRMDTAQREIAQKVVLLYNQKRQGIKEVLDKYPSSDELFEALFGRDPEGEIEVIDGPITLAVRCNNPRDYARLYWGAYLQNQDAEGLGGLIVHIKSLGNIENGDITDAAVTKAQQTGGVSVRYCHIPSLEGSIIGVNDSSNMDREYLEKTLIHEEEHAWQGLFAEATGREDTDTLKRINALMKAKYAKTDAEKARYLKRYLRGIRNSDEEATKREVLAYFRDGSDYSRVLHQMTDRGLYDTWRWRKDTMPDQLVMDMWTEDSPPEASREVVTKAVNKVFGSEAIANIQFGIGAYMRLRDVGYSDAQINALLLAEPFHQWKKIADRIEAQRREVIRTNRADPYFEIRRKNL